ncbi:hypothetical protein QDG88_13325 [Pseudoalteromonas piscicida]|uniref:hypothetical protein n=1 Tax=Pseudoalteromonas piscicida TaxID=43662 RepID=UPI00273940ED|nr:hypothetical protein [Pseudoalteromonas piscicida]MDP4488902.1 hypothetical protein [Pseudoalteromonas piscicida]
MFLYDKKKSQEFKRFSQIVLFMGIATCIGAVLLYFTLSIFGGVSSSIQNDFGGFFGGVVTPVLTFLTIWLLIRSIDYQRDELAATRLELEETKEIHKISSFQLERQLLFTPTSDAFDEITKLIMPSFTENIFEEYIDHECINSMFFYGSVATEIKMEILKDYKSEINMEVNLYYRRIPKFCRILEKYLELKPPLFLIEVQVRLTMSQFIKVMSKLVIYMDDDYVERTKDIKKLLLDVCKPIKHLDIHYDEVMSFEVNNAQKV